MADSTKALVDLGKTLSDQSFALKRYLESATDFLQNTQEENNKKTDELLTQLADKFKADASQTSIFNNPALQDRANYRTEWQTSLIELRDYFVEGRPFSSLMDMFTREKRDDVSLTGEGGHKGSLLERLLGMASGFLGSIFSVGTIGALIGVATMIGGLVYSIATDSPFGRAVSLFGQAILTVFKYVMKATGFLIDVTGSLLKGKTLTEAFDIAKFGEAFPRLEKVLAPIGEFIDSIVNFALKRPPLLKPAAGTFANALKVGGPAIARLAGKSVLNLIPFVGTAAILGFAIYRLSQGDLIGGVIELISGALSLGSDIIYTLGLAGTPFTVGGSTAVGAGIGVTLDILSMGVGMINVALDMAAGGMTPRSSPDNQKQKAEFLLHGARKLIQQKMLKLLVTQFSSVFSVAGALKLIAQGRVTEGLNVLASEDNKFALAAEMLGLEAEDLGMTPEEFQERSAADYEPGIIGKGINVLKTHVIKSIAGGLTLGIAPVLDAFYTIAKGGNQADAIATLSSYIPVLGLITEATYDEPELADQTTADLAFNLFEFAYEQIEKFVKMFLIAPVKFAYEAIEKTIAGLFGAFVELVNGIDKSLQPLRDSIDDLINDFSFKKVFELMLEIKNLPFKLLGAITTPFKNILTNLEEFIDGIRIGENLNSFWRDFSTQVFNFLNGKIGTYVDDFKSWWDTTIASKIWMIFGPGFNPPGLVGSIFETIIDGVQIAIGKFNEYIRGVLKTLQTTIDNVPLPAQVAATATGIGTAFNTAENLLKVVSKARDDLGEAAKIVEQEKTVKLDQMDAIDVAIEGEQFEKLINVQERTFDVLNVQITRALKDINESVQNIQNLTPGLLPSPQTSSSVSETFNAASFDRDMNR